MLRNARKSMAAAVLVALSAWVAQPVQAGFTYQGQLKQNGSPANGTYDLGLTLWDASTGGNLLAIFLASSTPVTDGLFTVELPWDAQFTGGTRWLQIAVNGTLMSPRTKLTPTPYATFSQNTRGISVAGSGDVGIGAASPTARLQVGDGGNNFGEVTAVGIAMRPTDTVGLSIRNSVGGFDTALQFCDPAFGCGYLAMNETGDFYLTGDGQGRLGIGTTSPQQKLDVNGWVRCHVVQITGGSDLAEPFDVREAAETKPGMVVSIDPREVGKLKLATQAYDRTVAGVVSGANGVQPGLILTQEGRSEADGKHPVALSGRVWVYADAAFGPITAGDLLTTSDTPGHAMRVSDHSRANGAILGKAMSSLENGRGMVLVLVGLQ